MCVPCVNSLWWVISFVASKTNGCRYFRNPQRCVKKLPPAARGRGSNNITVASERSQQLKSSPLAVATVTFLADKTTSLLMTKISCVHEASTQTYTCGVCHRF